MDQPERGALADDVYVQLKAAIRAGAYPPGGRLVETELVARFGVSRTPVRHALTRLEMDGLVQYEPRLGIVVTRPDHQQVVELYAMREVLESAAARFAAQHASQSELHALEEMLAEEAALTGAGALSALNVRIHALLHRAAHNRYLLRSLLHLTDTMALLPALPRAPARVIAAQREHQAILAALRARDGDAAAALMADHIRTGQALRIRCMLRHDVAAAGR